MSYKITQEFIERMNRPSTSNLETNYILIAGFSEMAKALEQMSYQIEILTYKVQGIGIDLETIRLRKK